MFQFYYADLDELLKQEEFTKNIREKIEVTAVRPAMWEEHCLECSAPACYSTCLHYTERSDGRCKRFENGLRMFYNDSACCSWGSRVKFKKWSNMMTVLFPSMLSLEEYGKLHHRNQKIGQILQKVLQSKLPQIVRWQIVRSVEYLRRLYLRNLKKNDNIPDAFILHCYSYAEKTFSLILEIFDEHTSVFKTSLILEKGENIKIVEKLSEACAQRGNLVKIYPENNMEVELDILWCDFVKGRLYSPSEAASHVKCVVWDLDKTVWDGILIETNDEEKLSLNPHVLEVMQELDERGILQSIASKNEYNSAWEMVKKLNISQYFLYPQIHWNAKSSSMKTIAKNLNIGIDSLAFIDDAAFERGEVNSVYPQIRTYDISEIGMLLEKPEFDVPITEESRNRREMYQAEEKRKNMYISETTDVKEFLKKCNLRIRIFTPTSEKEILRCFELVVRTNQLNISGVKYTQEQFDDILQRENCKNFAFSCEDNFGKYGIVGYGQLSVENEKIIIHEFAMSCRVAEKYVESALLTELLKREKCSIGELNCTITKKNILLRNTLEKIGCVAEKHDDSKYKYVFNEHLVGNDIVHIIE